MKHRIINYRKRIDDLIKNSSKDTDWEAVLSEHLNQISFFQHERLVHLIVTMTFAILEMLSIILFIFSCFPMIIVLPIAFLVLLVPYIFHYYLLENEVQKMYEQYDEILSKIKKQQKAVEIPPLNSSLLLVINDYSSQNIVRQVVER